MRRVIEDQIKSGDTDFKTKNLTFCTANNTENGIHHRNESMERRKERKENKEAFKFGCK